MALDGFVTDSNGSVSQLYPDPEALQATPYMNSETERTGAVLMGRRTFEMGDPVSYVGNYEFQVPIFVLTHHAPRNTPKQDERLTFTFCDDLGSAVEQAKAAAGDRAVQAVGGASVIQQLLRAGSVDELRVDAMPVLLGGGLRLFENVERVRLEKIQVEEVGARTSLAFRVRMGCVRCHRRRRPAQRGSPSRGRGSRLRSRRRSHRVTGGTSRTSSAGVRDVAHT